MLRHTLLLALFISSLAGCAWMPREEGNRLRDDIRRLEARTDQTERVSREKVRQVQDQVRALQERLARLEDRAEDLHREMEDFEKNLRRSLEKAFREREERSARLQEKWAKELDEVRRQGEVRAGAMEERMETWGQRVERLEAASKKHRAILEKELSGIRIAVSRSGATLAKGLGAVAAAVKKNREALSATLAKHYGALAGRLSSLDRSLAALRKKVQAGAAKKRVPLPPGPGRRPTLARRPAPPAPPRHPGRPARPLPGRKAVHPEIQRRLERIQALQLQLERMKRLLDMVERKSRGGRLSSHPHRPRGRKL